MEIKALNRYCHTIAGNPATKIYNEKTVQRGVDEGGEIATESPCGKCSELRAADGAQACPAATRYGSRCLHGLHTRTRVYILKSFGTPRLLGLLAFGFCVVSAFDSFAAFA